MVNKPRIQQDTIPAALRRAVEAVPSKTFLDFGGDTFTFGEVDKLSDDLARGLTEVGIRRGQVVATILDNNIDAVVAWLAINKLGAISAPVNTAFRGDFLRNQLNDCGAELIIAEPEYTSRVAGIRNQLPGVRHFVVRGTDARSVGAPEVMPLDALRLTSGDPVGEHIAPSDPAMLVYTSGTTGTSKGCVIPHNMPCNMGWNALLTRGYCSDDTVWSPLPFFHLNAIGAVVVAGLILQCTAAIAARFSVSRFWPEIERSGATRAILLGSMAALIAEAPDNEAARRCYGQLRGVVASPFGEATAKKWRDRFGLKTGGGRAYGLTEAASITDLPGGEHGPPGSSGRFGHDFELQIVDENDNPVALGEVGEIVCRSKRPNIMFQGYWNRPADTVTAWRNLWFHTGDLGSVDENNFLYFVDRKKDYIRRRGENISTHEMEAIFRDHPAIQDVAVHSVVSPIGEDDVKVTAEIKPDATVTEEELCRWSVERVPYFAVPLYIEFRESLPRGATGKVLKDLLRREGKTRSTWDREAAGVVFERR
jgi:crotonobetaine/carnitine-CoA ligase